MNQHSIIEILLKMQFNTIILIQVLTLQDPNCVNVMILYITDVDRGWGLLEEDKVLHYKILIVLM
jgi:hypothetical protein